MKPISTALALGRTLLLPLAGVGLNPEGTHGCAWGMIRKAAPTVYQGLNQTAQYVDVDRPCDCEMGYLGGMVWGRVPAKLALRLAIVHVFNQHVATTKDWTMDQLIDWIAANEPDEPVTVDTKEVVYESL